MSALGVVVRENMKCLEVPERPIFLEEEVEKNSNLRMRNAEDQKVQWDIISLNLITTTYQIPESDW